MASEDAAAGQSATELWKELFLHQSLDGVGRFGQRAGEAFEGSVRLHVKIVFDADPDFLLGNVNAGLDGEDHALLDGLRVVPGIMDIDADQMADAVDEVLAQAMAVEVLAM